MNIETAIILAGGSGTRLQASGVESSKPLASLGGDARLVDLVVARLRVAGVTSIVFALYHRAREVREAIEASDLRGIDVSFVVEAEPLGTAGVLAQVDQARSGPVFVANCDVLTDLDLRELARTHASGGFVLTVGASRQLHRLDVGVLDLDGATGRIVGFREKPIEQRLVNMGVYVVDPRALDVIRRGESLGMDTVIARLLDDEAPIGYHAYDGVWADVADARDLSYVTEFVRHRSAHGRVSVSTDGEIAPCSCS